MCVSFTFIHETMWNDMFSDLCWVVVLNVKVERPVELLVMILGYTAILK